MPRPDPQILLFRLQAILSLDSPLSRASLLPGSKALLGEMTRSLCCTVLWIQIPATPNPREDYTYRHLTTTWP